MSTSILCMAVVFSAPAHGSNTPSVYTLSRPFETETTLHKQVVLRRRSGRGMIIRGQTPGYDEDPSGKTGTSSGQSGTPTFVTPPNATPSGPLIVPNQVGADPFLAGQTGGLPRPRYGVNGPQPYRLNRWVSRYDLGILPQAGASRGLGGFGVFEFDSEWEYATPVFYNWIASFTQEFNYRAWEGPSASPLFPTTSLPGSVYRFGWDLKLATPANQAWSAMVAFNPSLNSDFEDSLSHDAWNWDGRGMIFYRATPQWTWVFGAGYWDRVTDKVLPYAGVIFTPDDRWEWRILFPESRISYFLGQPYGFDTWLYTRGEFHSEAYEIKLETTGRREQVEVEDWRLLMGLRFDNGWFSSFIEAGWVFGRNVDYLNGTPGFDVTSGFIGRMGLRF